MAQNIVFKVVADTQGVVAGMEKAGNATKKATNNVTQLDKALGNLKDQIIGVFAISQIMDFGKKVMDISIQVQNLNVRMQTLQGTVDGADRAFGMLSELAKQLGLNMMQLTTNYTQFVSAAKASGMEVAKAEKIFKNMTFAIKGSGASAEQASRAMTALTQMIGKGTIMAEELKGQLGEAMPQAIGWMAKSMGVGTKELFKMMEQGKLTSDALLGFSEVAKNEVAGSVDVMSKSIGANVERLKNAWEEYMASLGERFYGQGGGAEVLANMLEAWTQLNETSEQYAKRQARALLANTEEVKQAEEFVEKLREQKLTQEQINQRIDERIKQLSDEAKGITAMNQPMTEQAKVADKISNARRIELLNTINALKEEKKILNETTKTATVAEKKVKAVKKEKDLLEEVAKIMAEMYAEEDRHNNKVRGDLRERTRTPLNIEGAESLLTPFESEIKKLDRLRRVDEISHEEYLKRKLEAERKYGKDASQTSDELFANQKQKEITRKEREKELAFQLAEETASGVTNLFLAGKQKELSQEAELVAKQREQGLISEAQYDNAVRAIKRKQAQIDKAGAIAQIAINTAVAVANPTNLATGGLITPLIVGLGAVQAGIVLATPIPYKKGTKKVPMVRGAVRGQDSVHAILTPDERVVPAEINSQPGYSKLLDLAQDRKISDSEAGFLAELATNGMRQNSKTEQLDPEVIGRAIAKYVPHTKVNINDRGIAVITERSHAETRRLRTRIG